ncbi:hypothetical protein KI387_035022, partial [Taxus chinensis]
LFAEPEEEGIVWKLVVVVAVEGNTFCKCGFLRVLRKNTRHVKPFSLKHLLYLSVSLKQPCSSSSERVLGLFDFAVIVEMKW